MRTALVKRRRQVSNSHKPPLQRKSEVKLLLHLQHVLDVLPCKATCLAADCTHPSRALFCLLPSGLRRRRLETPPDGFRQQAVKKINAHDSTHHVLNCDCELLAQLDAKTKMTLLVPTSVSCLFACTHIGLFWLYVCFSSRLWSRTVNILSKICYSYKY